MAKLYIGGTENGGEGYYFLVADTGECIASHFSSSREFARGDLYGRRTARQVELKQRFGEHDVLYIGDDEMTWDDLMARNRAWVKADNATSPPAPSATAHQEAD